MKKIALVILLLASGLAWAGTEANPAEYTVSGNVSSSRLVVEGHPINSQQQLSAVIDGKKYELLSEIATNTLLALGNYKAKLVKDEHKTAYDSLQVYEFLFADKKPESSRSSGRRSDRDRKHDSDSTRLSLMTPVQNYGRLGIDAMHSTWPFIPSAVFSTEK